MIMRSNGILEIVGGELEFKIKFEHILSTRNDPIIEKKFTLNLFR